MLLRDGVKVYGKLGEWREERGGKVKGHNLGGEIVLD